MEKQIKASRVRNGYDSNGSGPRPAQAARACSYSEFLKCKPLDFKGTEGVVGLTRWFEKMESVFSISNCPATSNQIHTLQRHALHGGIPMLKTTTPEDLMPCHAPIVKASKSKTMQEVIEFTTELMEDKTHAYAERQAERKRKYDDLPQNNQNQQQQNRRQNTGQAYAAGNSPCPPRCSNCNRVGHLARDCRIRPTNNNNNYRNNNNNQQGNGCFECGAQGHFKRNCPKLNNNDRGNQAGNNRAPAKVSFVSAAFSTLLDIIPNTLDHGYNVELADVDVIIGMGLVVKTVPFIDCAKKNVQSIHIPKQLEFSKLIYYLVHVTVATAPYRIGASEMKELSEQLKSYPTKDL
ncbi:putative reverse transcriptase domain-containing protein [Tanacetum coccineum]